MRVRDPQLGLLPGSPASNLLDAYFTQAAGEVSWGVKAGALCRARPAGVE